ncbi:MAG: hypothetical protein IE925_11685 [Rhodobacterales bacterium]|nr:hypothetical protein [Rhodobacterales bacterium]
MPEYDDDSVGYGSPPKRNQFKKGQSGNPHGRPKKADGIEDNLTWLFALPVRVRDTSEEVTMLQALVLRLRRLVADGDFQAIELMEKLIRLARKYNVIEPPQTRQYEDPRIVVARAIGLQMIDGQLCNEEGEPIPLSDEDDDAKFE